MNSTFKVGRITVAIGLVAFGVALLLSNLGIYSGTLSLIVRFWPVLLIGYGVEYLVQTALNHRSGEDRRIKWDVGGGILLAIIVIVSLGLSGIHNFVDGNFNINIGPSESRSEQKTVQLGSARELSADVGVGTVSLRPATTPGEVRVEATYTTNGVIVDRGDVKSQLEALKLNVSEGDVIRITTDTPVRLNNISINYVIYAPTGLKVTAHTGIGRIEVTGYTGDLNLTSNVGRIEVGASSGSLVANSGSGQIAVSTFEGPVDARTNVGSLDIRNVTGALQLDSRTGSIQVRDSGGGNLTAETGTGRIEVDTRLALQGNVSLKTQTGSVSLNIPKDSSIRATAQTRTGSLDAPSFMSVTRTGPASSAVGSNGDGAYTVSLEASTGSVHFSTR
jgi:DUF4097 and DUF4098 domain-containing protein YvlB